MFLKFQPFFLIAETPLHPGSGGSLSIVDFPIQRERHTGYPKLEPSGFKGALRSLFQDLDKEIELKIGEVKINDKKNAIFPVFGPESEEDKESHAGAIAFTDAKILLFPVKSLKGIFAWVTCPHVLERFKKEMGMFNVNLPDFFKDFKERTVSSSELLIEGQVVLEEFSFQVKEEKKTKDIANWFSEKIFSEDLDQYWKEKLSKSLVILKNDEFRDFVTNSTEVITRVKISNTTGTVEEGPWTEEYLPQDTILYCVAMGSGIRIEKKEKRGFFKDLKTSIEEAEAVLDYFKKGIQEVGSAVQIGGNQTIGKGFTRIQFLQEEENGAGDK